MDPCPERLLTGVRLDPAKANIQLDVERLDITTPDLAPAIAASETRVVERPSGTEDIEMGEPAVPDPQDKNVCNLSDRIRDETDADFSNPDV